MAKKAASSKQHAPQLYPRIEDDILLDNSKLTPHTVNIPPDELKEIIKRSVDYAQAKSGRTILNIQDGLSNDEILKIYKKEGKKLFDYFLKFCGDPAATAHSCLNMNCYKVAKEQFYNRTLQKQRMNSGWRYQSIARRTAEATRRFLSVSDIGSQEADFNARIRITESDSTLNIYVSVKNRSNTMGGQDWPKAIHALEDVASSDKNRSGPYICVFGIVMDKGDRYVKSIGKTKQPHSFNTEVWRSDFFWPFFSNCSYDEIIRAVLEALIELGEQDKMDVEIPAELLESFKECCLRNDLLDYNNCFNNPYKLLDLFCGKTKKARY